MFEFDVERGIEQQPRPEDVEKLSCCVIVSTERMSKPQLLQNSPILEFLFRLFGFDAATYLYFAEELSAPAGKDVQIIACKSTPLLSDFAFELPPVPCDFIPVHALLLLSKENLGAYLYLSKKFSLKVGCPLFLRQLLCPPERKLF